MRLLKTITVIILVLITINVKSQTTNDSIQIKQAALDYIEGWFYKDAARVDKAVHFEFVKRSIFPGDSIDFLRTINKSRMDYITLYHPDRDYRLYSEVFILDAMSTVASVKLIFNECIEYLHVAKLNGKWKIVNNLFTVNPDYLKKK
ncbi:MAG: nuclear transport factor 2 family protein [Deltaproteobacteria bacterium]|nr:nuclear transport factor 2 family protein [Deltaproteobacteria bacterium]